MWPLCFLTVPCNCKRGIVFRHSHTRFLKQNILQGAQQLTTNELAKYCQVIIQTKRYLSDARIYSRWLTAGDVLNHSDRVARLLWLVFWPLVFNHGSLPSWENLHFVSRLFPSTVLQLQPQVHILQFILLWMSVSLLFCGAYLWLVC